MRGRVGHHARFDGHRLAYTGDGRRKLPGFPSQIDFAAGFQAMADCRAGSGKSRERLAAEALHVTEAALALNRLGQLNGHYRMISGLG